MDSRNTHESHKRQRSDGKRDILPFRLSSSMARPSSSSKADLEPIKYKTMERSKIESLPVGILEGIFKCLAPTRRDREYEALFPNEVLTPIAPFRADCAAIRLTCKIFSKRDAPSAALFHDFNVWMSERNLETLKLVSKHPLHRDNIRRLVFVRPHFLAPLADLFDKRGRMSQLWSEELFKSRAMEHRDDARIRWPEKPGELISRKGFLASAYEQDSLLNSSDFLKTVTRCVGRLRNLESVVFAHSVPVALHRERLSRADMASRQEVEPEQVKTHPHLLPTKADIAIDSQCANDHILNVFEALAAARIKLRELVFLDRWAPSTRFSWLSIAAWPGNTVLSNLTTLDITPRDERLVAGGLDWSAMLRPLLQKTPCLVVLCLRFVVKFTRKQVLGGLWDLHFPELSILSIQGCMLSGKELSGFIQRHDHLKQLSLHRLRTLDARIKPILNCIRKHPSLNLMRMRSIDDHLRGGIETGNDQEHWWELQFAHHRELYHYLHDDGEWTPTLAAMYKR